MRRIFLSILLLQATLFVSCSKQVDEQRTLVQGYVLTEDSIPIPDANVGVFALSNNFSFNSYRLVKEVITDQQGYYSIETEKVIEIVSASKPGYFDLESTARELSLYQNNRKDIFMNSGCKVNLVLTSPPDVQSMCLFVPWGSDCQFDYSSKCFDENHVETMCYFVGGESARIEYSNVKNYVQGRRRDTSIFCPRGGEITLHLDYNF